MKELNMPSSFLSRYVNDGFSGGEKKRFEILQMMLLQPKLAILDETDGGLDIDNIRTVATGINSSIRGTGSGALIITHYSRILDYVKTGQNSRSYRWQDSGYGDSTLATDLEEMDMTG